jgi:membrane protease YdiL (CAAX protease family)
MPPTIMLLDRLDTGLLIAGWLVLLLWVLRWRLSGGGDPLRGSPIRPNRLNAVHLWVCLLVEMLGASVGASIARRFLPPGVSTDLREDWESVAAMNLGVVLVIATCLTVARATFRGGLRGYGLRLSTRGSTLSLVIGGWLVALMACGQIALGTEWLIRLVNPGWVPQEHVVFQALEAPGTPVWIRVLAYTGAFVLAPIGEELLFRGILQSGLRRAIPIRRGSHRHRWVAILLTATFFGLLHMPTPQYVPALIVLGILLGYLYERTGSLLVPILVHMLFNGKSLLWRELQLYAMQSGVWST